MKSITYNNRTYTVPNHFTDDQMRSVVQWIDQHSRSDKDDWDALCAAAVSHIEQQQGEQK